MSHPVAKKAREEHGDQPTMFAMAAMAEDLLRKTLPGADCVKDMQAYLKYYDSRERAALRSAVNSMKAHVRGVPQLEPGKALGERTINILAALLHQKKVLEELIQEIINSRVFRDLRMEGDERANLAKLEPELLE